MTNAFPIRARVRRSALDARGTHARRQDAALRQRQRHRPPGSYRPSSERDDARRPRAAGVSSYSVYPLYDPYRLVIDCVRESSAATRSRSAAVWERPQSYPLRPCHRRLSANGLSRPLPDPAPIVATGPDRVRARRVIGGSSGAPPLPATAPSRRWSPPRAAEKCRRRLFNGAAAGIECVPHRDRSGHGGHDPGAQGTSIAEAELVLDIALRVESAAREGAGIEVILTRRTDDSSRCRSGRPSPTAKARISFCRFTRMPARTRPRTASRPTS